MEFFTEQFNGLNKLTIFFAKSCILDVFQGPKYASDSVLLTSDHASTLEHADNFIMLIIYTSLYKINDV